TPFLAQRPGLDSGVMMVEYTAHAAAAEARSLAMPMATQTVWASLGVESHASLAATAARRTGELLEAMETLVATELVVGVRALRLAGRRPVGDETSALFEATAQAITPVMVDRAFGWDIERARGALEEWSRARCRAATVQ
ncbi:MAG TPA: aromatic amino acid lyase, partial [Solirubrobacteraceae bacterium]